MKTKWNLLFMVFVFSVRSLSFADGKQITKEDIELAMQEASKEYDKLVVDDNENHYTNDEEPANIKAESHNEIKKIDENLNFDDKELSFKEKHPLEELALKVKALKEQLVVEKSSLIATQSPKKVKVLGKKTIFNFREDSLYEITTSVDHVTDIALKKGEVLTTLPTSGDTVRWNLSIMKSGISPNEQTHLIVKPLDTDIETNLIITTDQNVYHVNLKSGDFHMPSVTWNYPLDETKLIKESIKKQESEEPTINPSSLRFSYEIEDKDYPWKPIRVFDDGQKTVIQMPQSYKTSEAPALFLFEDDSTPLLVNYRIKGDLYIVDRLFEKAELRIGENKSILISLDKNLSFFEKLFN